MTKISTYDYLLEHRVKPSVQRLAVMEYLQQHHTHPTADEIYVHLVNKIPTLSKTTVYNTLRLFAEHGAALMLTIDEKKICFDGVVKPHAHFMCRRCGRLKDVELPEGAGTLQLDGADFMVEETHVYYKGLCRSCQEQPQA